jgi:hypothetical protein
MIEVEVFDGTDPTTSLVALSSSFQRGWFDQFNDVGSGTVSLHVTDEDLAANPSILRYGNIFRFSLEGAEVFASLLELRSLALAPPGEDAEAFWTFAGRGVLALLEDATVHTEFPIQGSKARQRAFDFTAIAYDDSTWIAANETHRQDDSAGGYAGYPLEWPDPLAYWIWSRESLLVDVPVGSSFFRKDFTLAADSVVAVFATADDDFRLWLDGDLVLENWLGTHLPHWQETFRKDLNLSAGTHQIAVQAANSAGPIPNPASFIVSIMELDPGMASALTGTVFARTDATWVCLDYPVTVPGMTVGEILRILVGEAQARGDLLEGITLDFTDTADSNAAAWAEQPDITLEIGRNLLDVMRLFVEQFVDVEMTPTLELKVYNKGTLGQDLAGSVSLVIGEHFELLTATGHGHLTNAIVARDATGALTTREDATSLAERKRREAYIEIATAPTEPRAHSISDEIFVEFAKPWVEISAVVIQDSGVYADWATGDVISIPGLPDGTPADTTILSITVEEDEETARPKFALIGTQDDASP